MCSNVSGTVPRCFAESCSAGALLRFVCSMCSMLFVHAALLLVAVCLCTVVALRFVCCVLLVCCYDCVVCVACLYDM